MKKIFGIILIVIGIVHGVGCLIEGRLPLLIVSVGISAVGMILFKKGNREKTSR